MKAPLKIEELEVCGCEPPLKVEESEVCGCEPPLKVEELEVCGSEPPLVATSGDPRPQTLWLIIAAVRGRNFAACGGYDIYNLQCGTHCCGWHVATRMSVTKWCGLSVVHYS